MYASETLMVTLAVALAAPSTHEERQPWFRCSRDRERHRGGARQGPALCDHGVPFLNLCECAVGWTGESCDRATPGDDAVHMDYGRVRHIDDASWRAVSQRDELKFWKATAVPRGNALQSATFRDFGMLPRDLGHVLEIGAGPYSLST